MADKNVQTNKAETVACDEWDKTGMAFGSNRISVKSCESNCERPDSDIEERPIGHSVQQWMNCGLWRMVKRRLGKDKKIKSKRNGCYSETTLSIKQTFLIV